MMIRSSFVLTAVLAAFTVVVPARADAQTPAAAADGTQLELFVGLDGLKQPVDLGINANMGVRVSANAGAPLIRRHGLGVQFGVGLNLSDSAVHVLDQVEGTSRRTQTFVTAGLFQRPAGPLSWSLAYDWMGLDYYDDVSMHQLRGDVAVGVTASDRVGSMLTRRLAGADASVAGTAVRIDPMSQVSGYWERTWPSRAVTRIWGGVAAGHGNVVFVFPDDSRDEWVPLYGADLLVPLNERIAMAGAANLVTPTATGTVDAYMGVVIGLGGRPGAGRFSPRPSVANNPTFALDLVRR